MEYDGEFTDQRVIAEKMCRGLMHPNCDPEHEEQWSLGACHRCHKTSLHILDPGSPKTLVPASDVARAVVWTHLVRPTLLAKYGGWNPK